MADVEGLHLKITGDSSQAVTELKKTAQAAEKLHDIDGKVDVKLDTKIDTLKVLEKARINFMSMGEKLAENFSSGFMKKTAELSVKLNDFGKNLENKFNKLFTGITIGLTAVSSAIAVITKNALSIGGAFEAQITNVKVISGATEAELDMLIKKAREMGAALPITAKDAATAMELLAQRGTKAKDILASVADVSALAISQNVDMGSAADLLGSTMTNFGISIENAAKVTDIFNNASNQSALNMSKLIEAMKYVGPAASSVGMSLKEAVSAMEVLANSNLSGEMIGTGLSMILSRLAKESQVLGVQTKNLDGTMRPLKDIFSELQAKGFSLADASTIFGERAVKAALNLAKYSSTLAENEKNLQKWGSTQAAVNEKMKAWPNVWNAFKSATEEVHIEIFTQIREQSKEAVSGIAELTREFSKWINKTQIVNKTLNAFSEGLGFRIPSSKKFSELLENINLQNFTNKIKDFGAIVKSIGESIAKFFNGIKTPLQYLIKHLDTFAKLSFWGWIINKKIQIPLAIMNIAASFIKLKNAILALSAAKIAMTFSSIIAFFSNPVIAGLIGGVALASNIMGHVNNLNERQLEIQRIQAEKERIQRELQVNNENATYYVDVNFRTGFEELPAEYEKASAEVRQSIKEDVFFLQEQFRVKTSEAVDFVKAKFPEMADAFKGTADNIEDTILTQISKALRGSETDFAALPVFWQRVTERINAMNMSAGKGSVALIQMFEKYKLLQREMEKLAPQNEFTTFSEEISRSLERLFTDMPNNLERVQKFLGNQNLELTLNVQLSQAQKQLEKFVKSASEKYSIPEEIVEENIFNRLKKLAAQGNDTAKSLAQGLKSAGNSLNNFLEKAEDAINYLGVSPEKFTPALNTMAKSIQKIDPITGKLTEQFKKAYDALKKWSNITFDQLTQRIQRLKKAVEGGFIDKSALENEFQRISQQVKLQVVTELEPTKGQYKTSGAYESVVASEYIAKMYELGGEVFNEMLKKEFSSQTGIEIGQSILAQLNKGFQQNSSWMTFNGKNISSNNQQDISLSLTNALNPLITKIEQLATPQQPTNNNDNNYSSAVNVIVSAIREVTEAVKAQKINVEISNPYDNTNFARNIQSLEDSINSLRQSNENNFKQTQDNIRSINIGSVQQDFSPVISALSSSNSGIVEAVNSVETAIKSMTSGNTYNIEVKQQGFMIQQKSDADSLARSTVNALRTGFGNGGL